MLGLQRVEVRELTEEAFKPYGNLFHVVESEEVRIEKWPKHPRGFRDIEDGVGGGATVGDFEIFWRDGLLYATNSAVANGDYCFALNGTQISKDGLESLQLPACDPSLLQNHIAVFTEINYHACGSQYFFAEKDYLLLIIAPNDTSSDRFPDNVLPSDFIAFVVPPGTGAHINSYVWHCPPVLLNHFVNDEKGKVLTGQAKVHSKIYYDPVKEHKVLLGVSLSDIESKMAKK
jgi:ureidoglycolate hydrolase